MATFEILAEHSYRELLAILEWFQNFSLIPVLIGGWAVFVYNSYFGSVDIDLVGPSMKGNFLDVVERYERIHGYEEVRSAGLGIEAAFRKPIIKENRLYGYVEIDVCTYEADTGSFHEEADAKLPYSLCSYVKHVQEVKFNAHTVAYIPQKPLFLLGF